MHTITLARDTSPATESAGTKGALDGRANILTCKGADSLRPGSVPPLAGRFSFDTTIALACLLAIPVGFMLGAALCVVFMGFSFNG